MSAPVTPHDYVSIAEAAEILAVSERTVRRWIEADELAHLKIGQTIRIPRSALDPKPAKEAS